MNEHQLPRRPVRSTIGDNPMTDKLLPCPFCGNRMEISGTIIRHRINTDCVISFQAWDDTAFDKWNTRSPPPEPTTEVSP